MTTRAPAQGYRRKPRWIPIVAVIFLLTPFGNFLMTLASLHIPRWYKPEVWSYWIKYIPTPTWALMGFIFLSGLSLLLFVRTWALILTLITLATVVVYNLIMVKAFSLMGTFALSSMVLTTVATSYFLYFSRFRRPYTNPKMRWWETSPRFRIDIPVKIEGVTKHGTLVDISLTCTVARAVEKGYGIHFDNLDRESRRRFKLWMKQLAKDPSKLF